MEIRRATTADAPAVARTWYPGWCDAHLGNVSQRLVDARPPETFEPRAAEHVRHTTVATGDGAVAGLAVVAGNTRARRFCERQGWTDEGPFDHRAPHPDGPIPVPAHRYTKPVHGSTAHP